MGAFSPNMVQSATLTVHLVADQWLELYKSQGRIDVIDDVQNKTQHFKYPPDGPLSMQRVTFPSSSDSVWLVSSASRSKIAELILSNQTKVSVKLSYVFDRNATAISAIFKDTIELRHEEATAFARALNDTACEG